MNFKTKPYKHQQLMFDMFKDREYSAIFADMGTGKSKVVIDIAAHKFLKGDINAVLVIAPNNVHIQWIQEQFPIHCSVNYWPFTWKSGKMGSRIYANMLEDFIIMDTPLMKVFSCNVEAFQANSIIKTIAEYVRNHEVLIIVDEASRIKNHGARRSKTIHKLNKYGKRCILTGTPTAKSPFDLWSQMEFLKKGYFDCSYFIFQHRYGVMMTGTNEYTGGRYQTLIDEKKYAITSARIKKVKKSRGGTLMPDDYEFIGTMHGVSEKNVKFIEANPTFTRYKRLDELKKYIDKDVFAIKKEDCLDLPPKIYERVEVDMGKEQRRIYVQLKKQLLVQYEGKELTIVNKVALVLRLMQITGGFFPYIEEKEVIMPKEIKTILKSRSALIGKKNVKYEAMLADLDEIDDDEQIIIWGHFIAELDFIYKELKKHYDCRLFYGGTSQEDRTQIIEDFQKKKFKIFIGNPSVAGFGLNLQNATIQLYFSNSFRTEDRLQAEDRSHRIGVKKACLYKDYIIKDSIDEKVFANIQEGKNLNDYFKECSLKELLG